MAALVCQKRRLTFENYQDTWYPSPKRQCSSTLFDKNTMINKLKEIFPLMNHQTLEKTLEDCNYNLDLAIDKLQELGSIPPEPLIDQANHNVIGEQGHKWVELFVKEMTSATSLDDAKERAAKALAARDQVQAVTTGQLKEQIVILQKLVVVQHERLKGYEECKQEVEKLNGMLSKCREEYRASEISNYTLKMYLNQGAQFGCSPVINTSNLPPHVY